MENWFPLSKLSSGEQKLAISGSLFGVLGWGFHFFYEFIALQNNNLPIDLVIYHYLFLIPGSFVSIKFLTRFGYVPNFGVSTGLLATSIIGLFLSSSTALIILFLCLGGFSLSIANGTLFEIVQLNQEYHESRGILFGSAFITLAILIIAVSLIEWYADKWVFVLFIILVYAAILSFLTSGGREISYLPQNTFSIRRYFENKDNFPIMLFSFFWGFFFINPYYLAILQFGDSGIDRYLNKFVIWLFLVILVLGLPIGKILDTIGRRYTILIGFYVQAILFLVLSMLENDEGMQMSENTLLILFSVIIGIGFSLSIIGGMVLFYDIFDNKDLRAGNSFLLMFQALGMVFAVFINETFFDQSGSLSLIMLFVLFTATMVTVQLKETLLSKDEIEWRNSVQYVMILYSSGIVLYSQDLKPVSQDGESPNEVLIGGAVVAISSIISEIVNHEGSLKVIQQEGYSLMFEEHNDVVIVVISLNELKMIRKKMKDLLMEFHVFFEEVLETWKGDINAFLPTRQLVKKFFG